MEKLRVLVVDDEPGMRTGVVRALRDYWAPIKKLKTAVGFELETAESGEEAVEKIPVWIPHIVLLDHKLPGISGQEVLDSIRRDDNDILVIMITAYATIETAVRVTKSGAFDFLAKPFTPEELRHAVTKAADHVLITLEARKLEEEKRQIRFQFISVLAHELKAPINAVQGYLEVLKSRAVGEELAAYDHMVDRSLVRIHAMRKLILDLLDLTKIESGKRVRAVEDLDLVDLVRNALETVAGEAAERGIGLVFEASAPVAVRADRVEAEIIVNNLITNAVKYNRDGGQVDVSLKEGEDRIAFRVADTGIGMSAEETARLFEDFVRIKNEKTRGILGSGLGLSTVKKIVELYGGSVELESEPDKGSAFTVLLPK